MHNIISKLAQKSSTLANVSTLAIGIAFSQAVPFFISPILSRLYSPSDFGILSIFTSVVTLITAVATGRYELSIIISKNDQEADRSLLLALLLSFLTSLFCLLTICIARKQISDWVMLDNSCLYLLPLTVMAISINQSFSFMSTREKNYRLITGSRITAVLVTALITITLGFIKISVSGLIIGSICGYIASAILLGSHSNMKYCRIFEQFRLGQLRDHASLHSDFIKFNTVHALSDIIQSSGIVFLISYFFGKSILGSYSFASRVILAPGVVISAAFAQVFFQKAAALHNENGDVYKLFRQSFQALFLCSFPLFLFVGCFSRPLFIWFFGQEWSTAGELAQYMAPWAFAKFLASPLSNIPIVLGKQKEALYISISYNFLALSAVWIVSLASGTMVTILLVIAIIMCAFTTYQIAWYRYICKGARVC